MQNFTKTVETAPEQQSAITTEARQAKTGGNRQKQAKLLLMTQLAAHTKVICLKCLFLDEHFQNFWPMNSFHRKQRTFWHNCDVFLFVVLRFQIQWATSYVMKRFVSVSACFRLFPPVSACFCLFRASVVLVCQLFHSHRLKWKPNWFCCTKTCLMWSALLTDWLPD